QDVRRAAGRAYQPQEHPHRGRLPGPVRPQESEDLTRRDREVQVEYSAALSVVLGESADLDDASAGAVRPWRFGLLGGERYDDDRALRLVEQLLGRTAQH